MTIKDELADYRKSKRYHQISKPNNNDLKYNSFSQVDEFVKNIQTAEIFNSE
jgi:hypothetical protein